MKVSSASTTKTFSRGWWPCWPLVEPLRDSLGSALFHSELVAHRQKSLSTQEPIVMRAADVSHYFSFPKEQALHQFNFQAEGGQLVGIMGGSGSGKSTMLGVLNGTTEPTFGSITINGLDIYQERERVSGWIGHVPQEDVLISELTVRENLAFNAKLSLGTMSEEDRNQRVDEVLTQLGLWDIQDLRVGSVLDKVISGGQRKRVNIGLELLRKPPVLFLDEPTSGLSSRDSEQILDILKELTYGGQLVFAVLHQPSSDLFKMLDRLFMLDAGGHPIYWGNPLDAVRHFNALASRVHADQCECSACGNVNPEQLFDIVEARTVDEYGRKTRTRRTTPKEWNDFYTIMLGNTLPAEEKSLKPLKRPSKVATGWGQWKTFFQRDVLTKLGATSNTSSSMPSKHQRLPCCWLDSCGSPNQVPTTRSGHPARAKTFRRFSSFQSSSPSSSACPSVQRKSFGTAVC